MRAVIIFSVLVFVNAQTDFKISRSKGNILKNLQQTQEFEDHIVTSNLDNPGFMRMLYREVREIYRTIFPNTGSRRHDSSHFQEEVPKSIRFPCETREFRSSVKPLSVHKLMPGGMKN